MSVRTIETSFSRWRGLLAVGIIVVAGLLVYHNSFGGPFIYDDKASIPENPQIRKLWPIWELGQAGPGDTVAGRPVLGLSLALNYQISGLKVWSYHAVNLAVHILAGLTLFGIVRRTLLSNSLQERFDRASFSLALVCVLIWLLHPLQTESVTYIVQRAESLMGLFYLLSLYCAIRSFGSSGSRWWYAGAITACVLGIATKEVAATVPLVVLLYDRVFVYRSFKEAFAQRWGLYVGLAGTWVIFAALALTSPRGGSVGFGVSDLTSLDYAITQCRAIVLYYLKLSFWPHPLVFDYGWPIVRTFGPVVPYALVLAAMLIGTLVAFRYEPGLGFLGVWFFVILAPSSSFVPIVSEVVAEHRMYLPLAAVITMVIVCGYSFGRHFLAWLVTSDRKRRILGKLIGYALVVAVLIVLGLLTVRRNRDYQSDLLIWQDTVFKRPDNWRAWNNRGIAYGKRREFDKAIADCSEAVRLNPRYVRSYHNRSLAYGNKGEFGKAIADCSEAIRLSPEFTEAYYNRGLTYSFKGEYDRAIRDFGKAIEVNPEFAKAYNSRGVAYGSKGEYDQAIRDFGEAIELNPRLTEAYYNKGLAYRDKGDLEQAIRDFGKAIELNPRLAQAYHNRGLAYRDKDDYEGAIRDFDQAIELNPRFAQAHYNRGLAYQDKGDLEPAIRDFGKAIALDPAYAQAYMDRGAAYSAKGGYERAIRDFNKVIRLNPDSAWACNNLAWILATCPEPRIRDGAKAVRLAERGCKLTDNRAPELLDTLAVAYAELGDFEKAIKAAEKAVQLSLDGGKGELAKDIQSRLKLYKAKHPYHE